MSPDIVDDLTPQSRLNTSANIEDARIEGLDAHGETVRALVARGSVFERISFSGCSMPSLRLRDVRLIRCDLSNAVLTGSELVRVEFIQCRLTGMKAIECKWKDVLLEGCEGGYAQFNESELAGCEFRDTQLREADFRSADLQGAKFAHTALNRAAGKLMPRPR